MTTLSSILPPVNLTTASGTLPVANGGTGVTALTSGYILRGNGTSAVSVSNVFEDGSGNIGIGTTSLSARFAINGGTGNSQTRFQVSTAEVEEVSTNAAQNAYANRLSDSAQVIWKITGSERMRLNGFGNVGLGTNSPAARFDVSGNMAQNIVAVAASDVDCTAGNFFTRTVNGNVTFTFSNPPASRAFAFTLEIVHTSGTITWPASVRWPGNTAPTLTTGRTHLITFVTDNAGTTWYGAPQTNYQV